MELKKWLQNWDLTKLKINAKFLEVELEFSDTDKNAAWEMYIELLTRTTTQYLLPNEGDEETALNSVQSLFDTTRSILKHYGRSCITFTKISIVILNQILRPFTTKWHKISLNGQFQDPANCKLFREELLALQDDIRKYTKLLSDIADVEDLSDLEVV